MQVQFLDSFVDVPGTPIVSHALNIANPAAAWTSPGGSLQISPSGVGARLTSTSFFGVNQAIVSTPFAGAMDSVSLGCSFLMTDANCNVDFSSTTTGFSFSGFGMQNFGPGTDATFRFYYDGGLSFIMGVAPAIAVGPHSFVVDINYLADTYAVTFDGVVIGSGNIGVVDPTPKDRAAFNMGAVARNNSLDDLIFTGMSLNVNPITVGYTYDYNPVRSLANFSQIINPFGIMPK